MDIVLVHHLETMTTFALVKSIRKLKNVAVVYMSKILKANECRHSVKINISPKYAKHVHEFCVTCKTHWYKSKEYTHEEWQLALEDHD